MNRHGGSFCVCSRLAVGLVYAQCGAASLFGPACNSRDPGYGCPLAPTVYSRREGASRSFAHCGGALPRLASGVEGRPRTSPSVVWQLGCQSFGTPFAFWSSRRGGGGLFCVLRTPSLASGTLNDGGGPSGPPRQGRAPWARPHCARVQLPESISIGISGAKRMVYFFFLGALDCFSGTSSSG